MTDSMKPTAEQMNKHGARHGRTVEAKEPEFQKQMQEFKKQMEEQQREWQKIFKWSNPKQM